MENLDIHAQLGDVPTSDTVRSALDGIRHDWAECEPHQRRRSRGCSGLSEGSAEEQAPLLTCAEGEAVT